MQRYKEFVLDAFQQEALAAIRAGLSVIVAAPTGCGKTLVAEYAIERALAEGSRIIYTAPIKALSNQKFRDFGAIYGERVGIMTGDVTINPGADALIMTTEIFRNTIFDNPSRLKEVRYVILDEAHYLDDPERGTVWEESIIFAPPEIRFILLSATISNLAELARWLRTVRPGALKVVLETRRPVPLHYYVFTGRKVLELAEVRGRGFGRERRLRPPTLFEQNRALIDRIEAAGHLPCIFFLFSRDACEKMAAASAFRDLVSPREKRELNLYREELAREFQLEALRPGSPEASEGAAAAPQAADVRRLARLLSRGIAYHHAGMLPTLKEVVERLFTSGLIKLLFATETFSLGVNMPAKAVAFESLRKFDGVKRDYMKTREFLQMAGRAGRRGIDREGFVYACVSPEFDRPEDARRVMLGRVEAVESQFSLSYATVLTLYSHLGDAIFEACEKSFVLFRHKKKSAPYQDMVSQLRKRIRLLTEMGYLEGRKLTPKGRFASLIYGHEIQAAELFWGGLLEQCDPHELNVVLAALVFEARREGWYVPLERGILDPLRKRARVLLDPFREGEHRLGLAETKRPDWSLSRAVYEWSRGAGFDALAAYTDLAPGDLVRTLRLGIQLLRQLAKPLRLLREEPRRLQAFRCLLREAMLAIKRDVVDAERQLRQALRLEAGEEAVSRLRPDEAEETAEGEPQLDHLLAPLRAAAPEKLEPISGEEGAPGRESPAFPLGEAEEAIEVAAAAETEGYFDLDREERAQGLAQPGEAGRLALDPGPLRAAGRRKIRFGRGRGRFRFRRR